jgi:hypothetical protein
MTLTAGTKLGSDEIVAPIGAGGMGEVYRARDGRTRSVWTTTRTCWSILKYVAPALGWR